MVARDAPERAEVVAGACASEAAARDLRLLAHRLENALTDVPRGFGHGDFYHGGQRLVRRLLPWARMGGDDAVRDYAERADVTGGLTRLESLVLAYWLDYASCQLPTRGQRRWIERNVDFVLRAVRADGLI